MNEHFGEVFGQLRLMMLSAAPRLTVARDGPGTLELRTPEIDPKTKQPGWFGTVTIKKTYVAVHLIPLYVHPELGSDISPELAKRRQGKSCFNFAGADETLFAELNALMIRCAEFDAAASVRQ